MRNIMPSKIRVLSDHTINKIAAGEVIENPASVVKELTENSIDAGATDICIEIQGGGRQMIRISDNGCGMNSDDALLCLERHATSKLRAVEEIHSISTMGFRGEAIPSIASISKFNLLTCPQKETDKDPIGTMVIIDGGKMISSNPAVRSQGTTIEVKSLFFNVPVRKKFLKSPAIDANEILKTVSLMSLGYPEIKFQLISDGKSLLTAPPTISALFGERLEERVEAVLGSDFAQNTAYVEEEKDGIHLKGMIGNPGYTRHNRTGQYLYINKRAVISPLIAFSVKEGFGTAIPTGRFPVFVIHLTIPGDWVDVNVHPQKKEVRLRQEHVVKEMVIKAVRKGIGSVQASSSGLFDTEYSPPFVSAFNLPVPSEDVPETWMFQPKTSMHDFKSTKPAEFFFNGNDNSETGKEPAFKKSPEMHFPAGLPLQSQKEPPLKVLATIIGYIIVDCVSDHSFLEKGCKNLEKKGMVLIDQKNAHARILFEKLAEAQTNAPMVQETLLIPYTIKPSSHEADLLLGAIPSLNKMGVQIREFGPNTFVIEAIPQLFGNSNLEVLMNDIIHGLVKMQDGFDSELIKQEYAKKIAQAATRAAVSYSQRLSVFEAQALLDQLIACKQPYYCPVGKPILSQITSDELARLFQR